MTMAAGGRMIHLGHGVAGAVRRLHPDPVIRVAAVNRTRGGAQLSFRSFQAAPSDKEMEGGKEEDKQQQQQQQQQQLDHDPDPAKTDHHGDMMSHSFGEGYSTRADEEGFGGIYGRDEAIGNSSEVSHPEYDKSQGCEVKEKEKARNQQEASS